MTSQTIKVNLAASETDLSYDIHVGQGLQAQAGKLILPLLTRPRVAIVSDEHVATYHLDSLQASLEASGISYSVKILPAGEATKSFNQLEELCNWLIFEKIDRDDMIIALGGGVIGDLTGFAASILRRGVGFIQIPTTLLAQVDSAVGGKTAVNAKSGKNLIGSFHQPRLVIADIDTLKTLSAREMRAGYAEIVKYGALGDAAFFDWLDENVDALMAGNADTLIQAITKSCAAKAEIVHQDERENGVRALLNLGHTFGHAYETLTNYSNTLLHGEGVGLGMVMAFQLSANLGYCSQTDADRIKTHLSKAGLKTSPDQIDGAPFNVDALMSAMAQDKKVSAGVMTFILARKIGDAFITNDVSENDVRSVLRSIKKARAV